MTAAGLGNDTHDVPLPEYVTVAYMFVRVDDNVIALATPATPTVPEAKDAFARFVTL